MVMDDISSYVDAHADEYIAWLQELLRQPSVAAQNLGMTEAAAIVTRQLHSIGAGPTTYDTRGGHPVVYGEVKAGASFPDARTLSFYNHYDVQPAEPYNLWHSDPWAAEIRDGKIWARGVSDNKGNIVARIAAIHAWQQVRGDLPLNLRFIIEGEEEIGSPHLANFTADHPDLCAADACIWEFGGRALSGQPQIHLGLKGMCYVELRVRAANSDLHSSLATTIPNAAWRLTWALASLKGPDERVRIPGFYDKVLEPTAEELAALEALPDEDEAGLEQYGINKYLLGLRGMDKKLRDSFQPTLTIAGMESGYTGQGTKTVMPGEAMAKVDMRLCANQDPHEIFELFKAHLMAQGFHDVEVTLLSALMPARTPLTAPIVGVVASGFEDLYGQAPMIYPTSAGSGPWYQLCTQFGVDGCTAGVGNGQSNAHAPNENITVEDYILGIKHIALIIERFAAAGAK
ncbi:MAG TPA: M20/M25/M40 family metallo-hydrolase [Thermomicrobiales bacterium]|nr:M20/M25/M40 family metallo-hydrolase [Thermomicrobiales bacterium]